MVEIRRLLTYRDVVEVYHALPEASRLRAYWQTSAETQEAFAMRRLNGLKQGMIPPFGNTLLGLPVLIDNTMEPETIRFVVPGQERARPRPVDSGPFIERVPSPTLSALIRHWWARARGRS